MSISTTYQNYSPDWWTPEPWLEWAHQTLGGDFFDPCPHDWVPTRACGLQVPWGERTYCNHPGSRGSTLEWWPKAHDEVEENGIKLVWCAFNVEQLRGMQNSHVRSPLEMPGWLVMPGERTPFIWGGDDVYGKPDEFGVCPLIRRHGEPGKSPGNWAVWWTNAFPAQPPTTSLVLPTGAGKIW